MSVRGIIRWLLWRLQQPRPTPAARTYAIPAETRILAVESEARVLAIPAETRVYAVEG